MNAHKHNLIQGASGHLLRKWPDRAFRGSAYAPFPTHGRTASDASGTPCGAPTIPCAASPLIFLLILLLFSCGKNQGGAPQGRDFTLQRDIQDGELQRIAQKAREEFPGFIRKLQRPGKGERNFRVKYPFAAEEESGFRYEELWLRDITFKEGMYYGEVSNQPFHIRDLSIGSRMPFYGDTITDWMYEQDRTIVGGRSIKYLIEQTSELDRDPDLTEWLARFPAGD